LLLALSPCAAVAQAPGAPPTEHLAPIARFVGGQWVADGKWSDGRPFHARNVFEWGVNHATLHNKTFAQGEQGEYQRYEDTYGWDAERGCLFFVNFVFDGSCHQTRIDTPDADTLKIGFAPLRPGDPEPTVQQTIHFTSPDSFLWTVNLKKDTGWEQIIQTTWKREPLAAATIDPSLFVASGPTLTSLVKEATLNATPHEVFAAWTTPEGIKSAIGVDSRVELRIGGPMELLFGKDKMPPGSQGSEGCQILAYVPDRMLAFSWNTPPKFPEERTQRSWVVMEFEPAGAGQTRMRITHTGFGAGGHWDDVRAYFDHAWGSVLDALVEHFKST
jgi:uncharacterized protein YndB with AHSA1/START domain